MHSVKQVHAVAKVYYYRNTTRAYPSYLSGREASAENMCAGVQENKYLRMHFDSKMALMQLGC